MVTARSSRPNFGESLNGQSKTVGYTFWQFLKTGGWGCEFRALLRSQGFSLGLPQVGKKKVMKIQPGICQEFSPPLHPPAHTFTCPCELIRSNTESVIDELPERSAPVLSSQLCNRSAVGWRTNHQQAGMCYNRANNPSLAPSGTAKITSEKPWCQHCYSSLRSFSLIHSCCNTRSSAGLDELSSPEAAGDPSWDKHRREDIIFTKLHPELRVGSEGCPTRENLRYLKAGCLKCSPDPTSVKHPLLQGSSWQRSFIFSNPWVIPSFAEGWFRFFPEIIVTNSLARLLGTIGPLPSKQKGHPRV